VFHFPTDAAPLTLSLETNPFLHLFSGILLTVIVNLENVAADCVTELLESSSAFNEFN